MRACDYKIFAIDYTAIFPERVVEPGSGGMDTVATGRKLREQRVYWCVAPTEALAFAAFRHYHPEDYNLGARVIESHTLSDIVLTV